LNSTRIICITTHALTRDLECTPKLSTRVTISWLYARATTYQKVCARIECSTKLASTILRVLHQKNAHSRSTNTFQTFPMKTTASPDRVQKTRSRGSSSLSSAQGDPTNKQKTLAGTARQSNGMWSILQRSTREEAQANAATIYICRSGVGAAVARKRLLLRALAAAPEQQDSSVHTNCLRFVQLAETFAGFT